MNYNRIILVGRLTRDPELKVTPSGISMTTFGLAVNRPRSASQQGEEERPDFFNIVTFRQTAEYAANYLTKGRLVLVEGRLQIREYMNRENVPSKAVEVIVDTLQSMEKRPDAGGEGEEGGYDQRGGGYAAPAQQSRGGYDRGGGGGGQSAPAQQSRGGYDRNAAPGGGRGGRGQQPAQNNDFGDDFDDPFASE